MMKLYKNISKILEEYSKVQWPSKRKTIESTAWVVTMSILVSVYLGVFDVAADGMLKKLVSLFGGN